MSIFWNHPMFVIQYEKDILYYAPHSHHAIQILFSPDKSIEIYSEGIFSFQKQFVFIPQNVMHSFSTKGPYLSIYLDPNTNVSEKILNNFDCCVNPRINLTNFSKFYHDLSSNQIPLSAITERLEEVLQTLMDPTTSQNEICFQKHFIDPRVRQCLEIIEQYTFRGVPIKASQLAKECNLSMFRLVHLFSETVGISIRSYALWCKMKHALLFLMSKESMIDTSYLASFSDQSHFSRSFKRMFGINPSEIFYDPSKNETFFLL